MVAIMMHARFLRCAGSMIDMLWFHDTMYDCF